MQPTALLLRQHLRPVTDASSIPSKGIFLAHKKVLSLQQLVSSASHLSARPFSSVDPLTFLHLQLVLTLVGDRRATPDIYLSSPHICTL